MDPGADGGPPYQMCTPTGAAPLTATVSQWGGLPPMVVTAVGTGAGDRDPDEVPNVLQIVIGRPIDLTTTAPRVPRP